MSYELDLISLFIEASFVVQMVMIILIVTSITSWWFIFDRWITSVSYTHLRAHET